MGKIDQIVKLFFFSANLQNEKNPSTPLSTTPSWRCHRKGLVQIAKSVPLDLVNGSTMVVFYFDKVR
jgi:hypothetical protein